MLCSPLCGNWTPKAVQDNLIDSRNWLMKLHLMKVYGLLNKRIFPKIGLFQFEKCCLAFSSCLSKYQGLHDTRSCAILALSCHLQQAAFLVKELEKDFIFLCSVWENKWKSATNCYSKLKVLIVKRKNASCIKIIIKWGIQFNSSNPAPRFPNFTGTNWQWIKTSVCHVQGSCLWQCQKPDAWKGFIKMQQLVNEE